MRSVNMTLGLADIAPHAAFDEIARFERYPGLAPDVLSVVAREDSSDWELCFRDGVLRWTENDRSDREQLTLAFDQDGGDFEEFHGEWRVVPWGAGCRAEFRARFDFGIPSLVDIFDQAAERVLTQAVAHVAKGMFGEATVIDGECRLRAPAPAGA